MTAIIWANPVNGDWDVAANWSTDTVPTSADDVTISAPGSYIVTISTHRVLVSPGKTIIVPDEANSLTFDAPEAALQENTGSLMVAGALTVNSGFVSLNEANTIGSVDLTGGVLAFGNAGALGAGTVTMTGGELLATANETLTNALVLPDVSTPMTFAAVHGMTLNVNLPEIVTSTLNFGAPGQDGVVIGDTGGGGEVTTVNVVAGTLKSASASFSGLLSGANSITVDAGATLETAGGLDLFVLLGGGQVVDNGAAGNFTLLRANFSGSISGPFSLAFDNESIAGIEGDSVLSGDNTYTGTTTIDTGTLQLGDGGATGSIGGGAITEFSGGSLIIDRNDALTLDNAISGDGNLQQIGTGVTSINTTNAYSGGTTISAGVLAIGAADALGTGAITMSGGELLGTADETIVDPLSFSGTSTIAAAHGTTLAEDASNYSIAANTILNIGAPGQDGTILWHTNPGTTGGSGDGSLNVQAGTLKAADEEFSLLVDNSPPTTVDAGATIDVAGFNTTIADLLGGGAVVDSGAAATLTLDAANFSGAISGPLSLTFAGDASLSGLEDYTGNTTLAQVNGPFTLANTGTYDLVANSNIIGSAASLFVNNGLFEKTGGGAVSDVTSNFINNGALNVLSGSIEFSGGFTNNGVIHGLVTQSGAVTTISAAAPSDFNGDSHSDILWQNASGQASIWDMNGNTLIGGGAVNPNPGPSWTEIGTGDFNGDGHADILWQNTSTGQVSIWEMNGNTLVGGGPVNPNPGPAWKAIGTGDFNGDGLSDILFQNTMSGQVSIWEMNGNKLVGGGPVSPNPGLAWKAVGTGDFTDDGHSDILFQNTTSGQVSIWEMNGNSLIGGGTVSANLGPDWQAIGTGDFNDDGHSDILFQNTTSGQVSIQEMNGTNVIGGGTISANPGLSWHAIGTGDFNGDGHSDILFQNTNGQAMVWEMNGTNVIGGGAVSPNPGSNWRAVA